jgi:hypothetical protein
MYKRQQRLQLASYAIVLRNPRLSSVAATRHDARQSGCSSSEQRSAAIEEIEQLQLQRQSKLLKQSRSRYSSCWQKLRKQTELERASFFFVMVALLKLQES